MKLLEVLALLLFISAFIMIMFGVFVVGLILLVLTLIFLLAEWITKR